MNALLGIAMNSGFALYRRDGKEWQCVRRSLVGRRVTSLIAREGVILAGTQEGVVQSDDAGATWRAASSGLTEPYVRWLAYHPDISDRVFAGTEPAGIYVSHDGGGSWRAVPRWLPCATGTRGSCPTRTVPAACAALRFTARAL